jgi:hypothetical protein
LRIVFVAIGEMFAAQTFASRLCLWPCGSEQLVNW